MEYYFAVFFLFLLCCWLANSNKQHKGKYLALSLIIVFLFFAFRVGFTPDYEAYERWFDVIHYSAAIDENARIEPGFQLLLVLAPSYRFIIILFTALFCILLYLCLLRYVNVRYWWIAGCSLFFIDSFLLGNMSGMRSGFVTIFFFLSILLSRNKRGYLFAIALLVIACFFHKSAIVLAPLLLLKDKGINKNHYMLYFIGAFLISVFMIILSDSVGSYIATWVGSKYEEYDNYTWEAHVSFSFFNLIHMAIIYFLLAVNIYALTKDLNRFDYISVKLSCLFYMIQVLPAIGVSSRFLYYLLFPFLVGCVSIIKVLEPSVRTIYIGSVIFISLLSISGLMKSTFFYRTYAIYDSILF